MDETLNSTPDVASPEPAAMTETSAEMGVPELSAPPTQELGAKWTLVALGLGILLTSAVRSLASDTVMIALKPFLPWLAFVLALMAQTGFAVYFGQEPSLAHLDEALLAGAGAVAGHTGVRSLVRHLPALLEALFAQTPPTPPSPPAAA